MNGTRQTTYLSLGRAVLRRRPDFGSGGSPFPEYGAATDDSFLRSGIVRGANTHRPTMTI